MRTMLSARQLCAAARQGSSWLCVARQDCVQGLRSCLPERDGLQVREAFPCSRTCGSESNTGVEMHAEAAVLAHEAFEKAGLVPVGWCAVLHCATLCHATVCCSVLVHICIR